MTRQNWPLHLLSVLEVTLNTVIIFFASLAGEKLNGVHVNPTSQQEMRENVEKVLQFVASKKIRMHQTSAKGMSSWQLPQTILSIEGLALFLLHMKQTVC